MKPKMCSRIFFAACALLLALGVSAQGSDVPQLQQIWKAEGLRTPESVLYHQQEDNAFLLVSEIEGDGAQADGKGGIAKLGLDGSIINQNWVRGLNAPKGMAYDGDLLYVADITDLVVISISAGEVLYRVPVPGAVFLNDVTVNASGQVFVSDTRTNRVHRIVEREVETWLEDMTAANGLKALGSNLIVGAGDTLWLIDGDKSRHPIATGFAAQIDGVELADAGEFLVSCWVGLIYYVHADGRLSVLIDSRAEKINTADIGYHATDRVVYVPNFFKDSVTAYHLQ